MAKLIRKVHAVFGTCAAAGRLRDLLLEQPSRMMNDGRLPSSQIWRIITGLVRPRVEGQASNPLGGRMMLMARARQSVPLSRNVAA
jgi:hypothetical protein